MALSEFEIIRQYFTRSISSPDITLGVGDDCALLRVPAGHELAVSIDTQVAGVHFPLDAPADRIAGRALRCALSDLAAMGATPHSFTLALTLPEANADWLADFSRGLFAVADAAQCPLVGGDTTRGPLVITLQVQGLVPTGAALRRSGAQVGDAVFVSGVLGDACAALQVLEAEHAFTSAQETYLLSRYYEPALLHGPAARLRGIATAMIDISDGLLADLGHICTASGVAAEIRLEDLPLSAVVAGSIAEPAAWQLACTGGDDYQLCFTAPLSAQAAINKAFAGYSTPVCIGEIVAGQGITCRQRDGSVMTPATTGYSHFV